MYVDIRHCTLVVYVHACVLYTHTHTHTHCRWLHCTGVLTTTVLTMLDCCWRRWVAMSCLTCVFMYIYIVSFPSVLLWLTILSFFMFYRVLILFWVTQTENLLFTGRLTIKTALLLRHCWWVNAVSWLTEGEKLGVRERVGKVFWGEGEMKMREIEREVEGRQGG